MIKFLKYIAPIWLKRLARITIKFFKYRYRRLRISRAIVRGQKLKIIVGAAETWQPGWYSTNEQWLDITSPTDWKRLFKNKRIITHVIAEHVLEHLTRQECLIALRLIAAHLTNGGRIRIALPDGYNPDENYLRHVGIGGIGDDSADHKQLLNVDTLSEILRESGFKPIHIEGYDANGNLIQQTWSPDDGFVRRSRANTYKNTWNFFDSDTSLIVDGINQ